MEAVALELQQLAEATRGGRVSRRAGGAHRACDKRAVGPAWPAEILVWMRESRAVVTLGLRLRRGNCNMVLKAYAEELRCGRGDRWGLTVSVR